MAKSKKEIFIEVMDKLFESTDMEAFCEDKGTYDSVMDFFNALKIVEEKKVKKFTDNGKIILQFMKDNDEAYNHMFKAKDFEAAGISSKTASGSLRKLVSDGYCDKLGKDPVIYVLTNQGKEVTFEEE